LFGKYRNINHFKLYVEGVLRSGRRYTPYDSIGVEPNSGRVIYEISNNPNDRNSLIGRQWFWMDISFQKWWEIKGRYRITWKLEVRNVFNNVNAAIVNPITGEGYSYGDNLPNGFRDPRFLDPRDGRSFGLPPDNPARWLPQRHFLTGISFKF
jgi:hypothetical protein